MTNLESIPEEMNQITTALHQYMSINTVNTDAETKTTAPNNAKEQNQIVCIDPLQLCCRKKQYEPGPKPPEIQ